MTETELLFDCIERVTGFFEEQGELRKALLWFESPNPNLGGITPIWLISHNRIKKLHGIIVDLMEGNIA